MSLQKRLKELEETNRALLQDNMRLRALLNLQEEASIDSVFTPSSTVTHIHGPAVTQSPTQPATAAPAKSATAAPAKSVTAAPAKSVTAALAQPPAKSVTAALAQPPAKSLITAPISMPGSINKYNSPEEKIVLFQSLFRGRSDLYAKRCYSKKHESAYYVPVCKNEWLRGLCYKPKIKCKECPNSDFAPLTREVIDGHLRNREKNGVGIVGIYPLLADETALLLAIDFDGEAWKDDITAFRQICLTSNISVAIERSRSGNGAHAWFFFEEPFSAVSVRKLGNALLTKAMSIRPEIKFTSYDRMFPSQDFMPKGGFGNLIALPLQGGPRKNGNSEFINEDFESYSDQWAYLASIQKIGLEELNQLLTKLCDGNELGQLASTKEKPHQVVMPWEERRPQSIGKADFPETLTITEANLLYIPKKGVTARAQDQIKRLAAFSNPNYYKVQKMRMSTYGIPRIIYSLEETKEFIGIPRGCRSTFSQLLRQSNVNFTFNDRCNVGKVIEATFKGELKEEQRIAMEALMQHENGVLSLPTAFGKSVIGASLIAERKCNTLILVHLHTLLNQWKKALKQFLTVEGVQAIGQTEEKGPTGQSKKQKIIGEIVAGKDNSSGIIDVALVQSLISNGEVNNIVRNYGMVIVDECHHASSLSFEKVLSTTTAKYVYGLTATPIRQDGQHPAVFMQCGPIRYSVCAKEQAVKRDFKHYIIPCFTPFRKPIKENADNWHITKIYSALIADESRNRQIVKDVTDAVANNRTPIILTQRKEHVSQLAELLQAQVDAVVISLVGTTSKKKRRVMEESLESVPTDKKLIIVATGKYVGEGFDYPRLDTLFLATPIAWRGTLTQYVGRLHRDYPGKKDVMVYDYIDIHVPVLERMYHKRLAGYGQIGYTVLPSRTEPERVSLIYNRDNFLTVFQRDAVEAKKKIMIVCPYLRRLQIRRVLPWLTTAIERGVLVTVITLPAEKYRNSASAVENLNTLKSELKIITQQDLSQKYVIIDDSLVWYGSIGVLDYATDKETIIRLRSGELASELTISQKNELIVYKTL